MTSIFFYSIILMIVKSPYKYDKYKLIVNCPMIGVTHL